MKTKDQVAVEALEVLLQFNRGTAHVTMGGGKTRLGLRYIDHFDIIHDGPLKVLVVAPKKSIFKSWIDEMTRFDFGHLLGSIKFSTYLSLSKQDLDYDIVVLDEVHNLKPESHSEWLCYFKGKILGLTGTKRNPRYPRGKFIDTLVPIRYEYLTDEAIEDELLNDYRIVVHKMSLSAAKTLKMEKNGKVWYTSELSSYLYWSSRILTSFGKDKMIMGLMRMKSLMSFSTKEVYAEKLFDSIDDKVILFTNSHKQADKLCRDSHHSKNSESKANLANFQNGTITKLSAVEQLSEGVNIPNLKAAIIMHTFSGNSPKSNQRLGRCLRLATNEIATVHMLVYKGTVDEEWCDSVLEKFDKSKISYVNS